MKVLQRLSCPAKWETTEHAARYLSQCPSECRGAEHAQNSAHLHFSHCGWQLCPRLGSAMDVANRGDTDHDKRRTAYCLQAAGHDQQLNAGGGATYYTGHRPYCLHAGNTTTRSIYKTFRQFLGGTMIEGGAHSLRAPTTYVRDQQRISSAVAVRQRSTEQRLDATYSGVKRERQRSSGARRI